MCNKPHNNGGEGMCDYHLEVYRNQQDAARDAIQAAYNEFMAQSEEERWIEVFTFMQGVQ